MVIPPPRFTLPASSSGGLSAWRWACALPRCGSRDFRISQRIPKIRTRPQSETDSDFVGLVRLTGVEPVRPFGHKHLKLASLPIPAQPHMGSQKTAQLLYCPPPGLSTVFRTPAGSFPDRRVRRPRWGSPSGRPSPGSGPGPPATAGRTDPEICPPPGRPARCPPGRRGARGRTTGTGPRR